MTLQPSRQDSQELQERRACAQVDVAKPRERNSSLAIIGLRISALVRAWNSRDDEATRDALRELAEEALLLARSDPLWPDRPGRVDAG